MSKYILLIIVLLNYSDFSKAQDSSVQKYKTVKIGLTHAPPLIFLSEDSAPVGMMIDFLREIAVREKWKIIWVAGSWPDVFEKGKNSEIDIMTYIAFSQKRTEFFDFSQESFVTGWGQVYTQDKNLYQNILDFNNKKIAVVKDDIHGIEFHDLCHKFGINCLIESVKNNETAFQMLDDQQVDGVVCGSIVGLSYESRFNVFRSSVMFLPTNALFATPKNKNSYLLDTLDSYLLKWRYDPQSPYGLGKKKWMNTVQSTIIPPWLKYLMIAVLGLLMISATIVVFLRQQVKKHVVKYVNQSKQLKQIIDLVPHMIYVVNAEGRLVLVNTYASNFFGISQLLNTTKQQLLYQTPQLNNLFDDDVSLLKRGTDVVHKEISSRNVSKENVILDLYKVSFDATNNIPSVLTVGVDITEEKEYQHKIRYMAEHDDLTGLANQQLLKSNIKNSIQSSKKSGMLGIVLFIDLDYFKNINDSLGHATGDKLLKVVSKRLQSILKGPDLVARIGGDEFIIQLKNVSLNLRETVKRINKTTTKVLELLAKKIVIDHQELYISASIGVVIYPKDASCYEHIMQRVDIAMYQAKSSGRNGFVIFKPTMERAILKRHKLVAELRKAIDKSEFIIEYQPQMLGDNEKIIGLEALIRWKHPSGKIINPNDFILVAEECGLIIPIGNWVLEQVCKQIQQWVKKYNTIPFITINLSVLQLHSKDLVGFLQHLFRKYSIPTHLIELELTETVMIEQENKTIYTLSQLKNLGIRLSIDDFGTGYSSLSYLKKLPFDKLKIDYSFVKDMTIDTESQIIVKTIIGMTQDLGLEVIAEGIENSQQLQMLMEMGCNRFQGFYFDKPNSAGYIEEKYLIPKA